MLPFLWSLAVLMPVFESTAAMALQARLFAAGVLPVLVIDDPAHAVPLARTLVNAGLDVLEITLRTPAALDAVSAIRRAVPEALVGVGTVLTATDVITAHRAGAQFLVSPGCTEALQMATKRVAVPFIPGVASASEAMRWYEAGYALQKFFPAEALGGVALLKALAGPLPHLRFCATGGIGEAQAPAYLALPNVVAVGGSWLTAKALLASQQWHLIGEAATRARRLRG